jgi:type IV secretory pathway TrbL component
MRRLMYMAALALVATLVLAPGAMAHQMNGEHMMPNGQMMDDNMMASPSASASATPSANNMMASPSASASASPSATPTASATATASTMPTASAARGDHGGVGSQLPRTGGVPLVSLVSVGALVLLVGSGLAAARLLRRST